MANKPSFAAHTPPEGSDQWHELKKHLEDVAIKAYNYAAKFGAGDLGKYAGLWHDLGKYQRDFQTYLEQCNTASEAESDRKQRRVPHAIYGAKLALDICPVLAPIISGHHAGLSNPADLRQKCRDSKLNQAYEEVKRCANQDAIELHPLIDPWSTLKQPPKLKLSLEFFTRMLFSCLVDADYLDTEEHFEQAKAEARGARFSVVQLWSTFEQEQQRFLESMGERNTLVNQIRYQVYQACFDRAAFSPGIFRLAVPTGGGKTLSGLAFALRHAVIHGLSRVIVAVPYTSIIEQTVEVYRRVFRDALGDDAVLEHHSAVRADLSDGDQNEKFQLEESAQRSQAQARLATQNWDAPLVVTTTVQLFESLFANRPSHCRKLHNIIGSVIILDEVQTLPIALLMPIVSVLEELVVRYRVTVVLCTATQPALEGESPYFKGFESGAVKDIVPPEQAKQHFSALQRVNYEPQTGGIWSCSWVELAEAVQGNSQALVVLNTRKDALNVLDALGVETAEFLSLATPKDEVQAALKSSRVLHLSTLLCGAHRREVLKEIRQRLEKGESCLLISTQVVEAGVDVDFPVVYRALGPLDRIVQAAGRCNREGKIVGKGRVVIFEPEKGRVPKGEYRKAVDTTRRLLQESSLNLHDPTIFEEYFQSLYQIELSDKHGIQEWREKLNYPEVAARFKLIEDDTVPVVIRYDYEVDEILEQIRRRGLWSSDHRKLQPYVVNLPHYEFRKAETRREVAPHLWVWEGIYDLVCGIPIGQDPGDSLYEPSILTQ